MFVVLASIKQPPPHSMDQWGLDISKAEGGILQRC